MPKKIIGGGAMKIEIRHRMVQQQPLPGITALAARTLDLDFLVLSTVDLRGLEPFEETDDLSNKRFELGNRAVVFSNSRALGPSQQAANARRMPAGLLHLAPHRVHVGI